METAMKHLSKGYDLLRKIMVCEDDVDRMALAKQELRAAYACLEKAQKAAQGENKQETPEVKRNG